MSDDRFVISSPSRDRALPFLAAFLDDSPIVRRMAPAFPSKGRITMVTATLPPPELDYSVDWGRPCSRWLIQEAADHLRPSPNSVVLFEDCEASPSDPYLRTRDHPTIWHFEKRVFWPVTSKDSEQHIEESMAWTSGFWTRALFSSLSSELDVPSNDGELSETMLQQIAAFSTRFIAGIFQGGGYLVWEREGSRPGLLV